MIKPPAGIPSTAKIASIDAHSNWELRPPSSSSRYEANLCDWITMGCTFIGSDYSDVVNVRGNTSAAGKPAATWQFYFSAGVKDFRNSSIYPVLQPSRYTKGKYVTAYYSY